VVHRVITRHLLGQAGRSVEGADEALQTVLHKIITRLMKLLTRRGALGEEVGSTTMADNDGDSDEARTLRPLQDAACTYRIAFGPRAGQKVLTVQGVMPRDADFKQHLCADIDGFSQPACIAGWRSAGTRPLLGPCVRPHPARRRALRR
jgi:hypothetical protein